MLESDQNRQERSVIGLSDTAWVSSRSLVVEPEATDHVEELPSKDSAIDNEILRPGNKIGNVLGTVRNKLIHHLSQDSDLKCSRLATVGKSDEEMARRAELKRLMHKRIQSELETQDPDIEPGSTPLRSARGVLSGINSSSSSVGPRDAIEFGVSRLSSTDARPVQNERAQPGENPSQKIHSDLQELSDVASQLCCKENAQDMATDHDPYPLQDPVPPPPTSSPISTVQQARSQDCFQLSNDLTCLDRILGPDNSFNSRHGSSSGDGHSALGVWLIAQGLRSGDNSILSPNDEDVEISSAVVEIAGSGQHNTEETEKPTSHRHDLSETRQESPTSGPITAANIKFIVNDIISSFPDNCLANMPLEGSFGLSSLDGDHVCHDPTKDKVDRKETISMIALFS